MSEPVLSLRDVSVEFHGEDGWRPVTHDVSFDVMSGSTVGLVGESGSGKSVTAMSVLDLLPDSARRSGQILFGGEDLGQVTPRRMREIRGAEIATIFQEPMTALNPVYTIGEHLVEAIRAHQPVSSSAARKRALDLLRQVRMPEPETRIDSYPHQLSGGQRQRAMIAMAMSFEPRLLIADEPTTALDVTVQAEILDLVSDLQREHGMALLIITHDMGVVAEVADHVVVMREGRVVESAEVHTLFGSPTNDYTRQLLDAVPRLGSGAAPARQETTDAPVLELSGVAIEYPGGWRRKGFRAVEGIDLTVGRGEIIGLVGESGSGKSTIGRLAMGLLPAAAGSLTVAGTDVSSGSRSALAHQRRHVSIVFQDPASSLDPRRTIGQSITDPLRWTGLLSGRRQLQRRAEELLEMVQLPRTWTNRYPHELSGGQRQRIGIARAMATKPSLMVADEPTSALDVSVQAAVLDLFLELQSQLGFSSLFISHDLSVVESLANRIVVLQQGRVVEAGPTADVLERPREAYTRRLIAAAPVPDPEVQKKRRDERVALASANRSVI